MGFQQRPQSESGSSVQEQVHWTPVGFGFLPRNSLFLVGFGALEAYQTRYVFPIVADRSVDRSATIGDSSGVGKACFNRHRTRSSRARDRGRTPPTADISVSASCGATSNDASRWVRYQAVRAVCQPQVRPSEFFWRGSLALKFRSLQRPAVPVSVVQQPIRFRMIREVHAWTIPLQLRAEH